MFCRNIIISGRTLGTVINTDNELYRKRKEKFSSSSNKNLTAE